MSLSAVPVARALATVVDTVAKHRDRPIFPQYTSQGRWRLTDPRVPQPGFMPEEAAWTAGFWPGLLWHAAALQSEDQGLMSTARELSLKLEPRTRDRRTHDLGFVFMPSCVLGHVISGDDRLRDLAVSAARTLVARFDERGGYLTAWGRPGDARYEGLTTIDALMNAAFVAWMARTEGDSDALAKARQHADLALENQVRPDGSTAQVAVYDAASGRFLRQSTHQGISDMSCWSRGQAWAIYGFALFASLTGDDRYVEASRRTADFFWSHMPVEGLVPWDFSADTTSSNLPDSSAMAIAAAGHVCLAGTGGGLGQYRERARSLVERLIRHALITDSANPAILAHGTFSQKLGVGVDESLIFGDFYFVDALARLSDLPYAEYLRAPR